MSDNQQIQDDGGGWKYFAPMLHMDDDDLDPYQYRLLGHYRRVCGANGGKCTESTETTANTTKMSVGKVSKVRKELAAMKRITLNIKKNVGTTITLIDCWRENILRYSKPSPDENYSQYSPHEHSIHHMNTQYSPHETKNNKKEQLLEKDSTAPENSAVSSDDKAGSSLHFSDDNPSPTSQNLAGVAAELPATILTPELAKKTDEHQALTSENIAIANLIEAWIDAQKIIDKKAYAKKGYRDIAQQLHKAGITPKDIYGFIAARKDDPFWKGKQITWTHIQNNIGSWKVDQNNIPPEHRIVNPEALLEPSPERELYPWRFEEKTTQSEERVDPEKVKALTRALAERLSTPLNER